MLVIAQGQGFGSRGSIWADIEIFEILGGAGDIYTSTNMPNYCAGPHIYLGLYVKKEFLALGPRFELTLVPQLRLLWVLGSFLSLIHVTQDDCS